MLDSITSVFGPAGGVVVAVLALILISLIALLIYRLVTRPSFGSGRRNKQARLAISDAINFGPKHKLVLLRRDDIEHLVLIGGTTDLLVESNIRRNAAVRPREQASREVTVAPPANETTEAPTTQEKLAAPRLRPVANQAPAKEERPKFVPRQEPAAAPEADNRPGARAAVGLSTPHVRPVPSGPAQAATAPETPAAPKMQPAAAESQAAPTPRAAPMPPVSPPVVPAVAGGLVAAPLAAAGLSDLTQEQSQAKAEPQESPFRDADVQDTKAEQASTTVTPRDETVSTPNPRGSDNASVIHDSKDHGSVADDMDALINELSAKR